MEIQDILIVILIYVVLSQFQICMLMVDIEKLNRRISFIEKK